MERKERMVGRVCPHCGNTTKQWKMGANASGTQRFLCGQCRKSYTPAPRPHAYDEVKRTEALRLLAAGVSGRRVGQLLHIGKNSAYNWA
ncbi:MAG: hypothetical protein LBS99_02330, partial [Clostridiales bacterium]|nr:hypothetical protein [Clostridiales bacterium]